MAQPLFLATERFDPTAGERWCDYCDFAQIPGLQEVVSLDILLCPRLVDTLQDEDWPYLVDGEERIYFREARYLVDRLAHVAPKNVLGLYRNPDSHLEMPPTAEGFAFVGYDLIEDQTQISALANCGGFPKCFSNNELNRFGVLDSFSRTSTVRRELVKHYPEEPHANCEMYAIWRWTGEGPV